MQGLSTLATIISVLSFPLIFIVLIYPHLAGARGRWYTVSLYMGISVGSMLVAVITTPEPHVGEQAWGWMDWIVVALGGGFLLAYIGRKYFHLKKEALAQSKMENDQSRKQSKRSKRGKRNPKSS